MDIALIYLPTAVVLLAAVIVVYNIKLSCQRQILSASDQSLEREKYQENLRVQAEKQVLVVEERARIIAKDAEGLKSLLDVKREENLILTGQLEKIKAENNSLQEKLDNQKSQLEDIQKRFTAEFENLAGKILKRNSEEFTLANQKNIGEVLAPLKDKIQLFEQKVEDTYQKGLKDQSQLKAELLKLYDLNNRMSTEAE